MKRQRRTPDQARALKKKIDLATLEALIEMNERKQFFRDEAEEIAHIQALAMLRKELRLLTYESIFTRN